MSANLSVQLVIVLCFIGWTRTIDDDFDKHSTAVEPLSPETIATTSDQISSTAVSAPVQLQRSGGFPSIHVLLANAWRNSLARRPKKASDDYLLLRYLMTNYSKQTRPVMRADEAVLVKARLFPIKILHVYEKNEVLEMTIRLQLSWHDPMLVWHPPEFDEQNSVIIPGGHLWVPDIQIANSVSDLYALMRDQKFDFKVHSDGSIWWHPTGNLVTRCELKLAFFPFDFQHCPIILESGIYSHRKLNLTTRPDKSPISLSMYIHSGDWTLVDAMGEQKVLWVTKSTAFTRVEFWVHVGRKTTYFKLNIIFPCCMLSGLQMLTFFFPLESTERVTQATSILLSVIVFQTMIVDQLPRSSHSIPLLCIYVDMLTAVSVVAVAEAVLVTSLMARKEKKVKAPRWARGFLKRLYKWHYSLSVVGGRKETSQWLSSASAHALSLFRRSGPPEDSADSETELLGRPKKCSSSSDIFKKPEKNYEKAPFFPNDETANEVTKLYGDSAVGSSGKECDTEMQLKSLTSMLQWIDASCPSGINEMASPPKPVGNDIKFRSYLGAAHQEQLSFPKTNHVGYQQKLADTGNFAGYGTMGNTAATNMTRTTTFDSDSSVMSEPQDLPHRRRNKRRVTIAESIGQDDTDRLLADDVFYNNKESNTQRRPTFISFLDGSSDDILLDWVVLARTIDAIMFGICLIVVVVFPIVLFGILPPNA